MQPGCTWRAAIVLSLNAAKKRRNTEKFHFPGYFEFCRAALWSPLPCPKCRFFEGWFIYWGFNGYFCFILNFNLFSVGEGDGRHRESGNSIDFRAFSAKSPGIHLKMTSRGSLGQEGALISGLGCTIKYMYICIFLLRYIYFSYIYVNIKYIYKGNICIRKYILYIEKI